jgi:hypothetical protein
MRVRHMNPAVRSASSPESIWWHRLRFVLGMAQMAAAVVAVVLLFNAGVTAISLMAVVVASEGLSLSVGFYYMANACGRLLGTLLSGVLYQLAGVSASLWGAVVLASVAGVVAMLLPPVQTGAVVAWTTAKGDD